MPLIPCPNHNPVVCVVPEFNPIFLVVLTDSGKIKGKRGYQRDDAAESAPPVTKCATKSERFGLSGCRHIALTFSRLDTDLVILLIEWQMVD